MFKTWSKSDYRIYFVEVKHYVKISYFLKIVKIDQANFSRFMKSEEYDYLFSVDRLELVHQEIAKKIT